LFFAFIPPAIFYRHGFTSVFAGTLSVRFCMPDSSSYLLAKKSDKVSPAAGISN